MISVPTIKGLNEIYKKYDLFIFDQWGVMHDGSKGYNNAIDCIKKLHKKNKILTIISNSSKRVEETNKNLVKIGFDPSNFKAVMTSGEMIWQSLFKKKHPITKKLGKNCFHIYNNRKKNELNFLKGLEHYNFVKDIEKANFILGCTPFNKMRVIDFIPILSKAKNKNLPFICANPDFETIKKQNNQPNYCIGTISELYKYLGGETFILGKPKINIYLELIKNFKEIKHKKILAIGDSIYHDIKGALNFGIDSLLITSTGIHHNFFNELNPLWNSNKNVLSKIGIKPTYICNVLKF